MGELVANTAVWDSLHLAQSSTDMIYWSGDGYIVLPTFFEIVKLRWIEIHILLAK
jgi:hypothetical protein